MVKEMRRPIIAGNWKMNNGVQEAMDLVGGLKKSLGDVENVEVVVCPPFTCLYPVKQLLEGSDIALGAQDVYWEEKGAFTGEVSVTMLKDMGCEYCIVGHSERRGHFKESDEDVNKKARALLSHGIRPIICVGETLEQREAGKTDSLVREQVIKAFQEISAGDAVNVVIAYEPIWAIGTGRSATSTEANRVIGLIRATIAELYGQDVADKVRIQYGGSVNSKNIDELMAESDIDGGLVGGASLKVDDFTRIVRFKE